MVECSSVKLNQKHCCHFKRGQFINHHQSISSHALKLFVYYTSKESACVVIQIPHNNTHRSGSLYTHHATLTQLHQKGKADHCTSESLEQCTHTSIEGSSSQIMISSQSLRYASQSTQRSLNLMSQVEPPRCLALRAGGIVLRV